MNFEPQIRPLVRVMRSSLSRLYVSMFLTIVIMHVFDAILTAEFNHFRFHVKLDRTGAYRKRAWVI